MVAVGRREKLKIFGGDWDTRDGTCVRDYVHTDDLAQAHQLAVEALEPGVARRIQPRLGDGDDVLEVLRACEKAVGRPIRHEIVGRRPGDPGTLIATPEKVIAELGWSARSTTSTRSWRPPGAGTPATPTATGRRVTDARTLHP